MAKRIYRELSDSVKKSISDSMKDFHRRMTYDERLRINAKQSESQKRYWAGISSRKEGNGDNEE